MLLVAVWLPESSHALLESLELIHQHHGQADSSSRGGDNHEAADGNCRVESNHVQVPQPVLSGPLLPRESADYPLPVAAFIEDLLTLPNGPAPPGAAPPELSHCWQFFFRTALPARAPSLIS